MLLFASTDDEFQSLKKIEKDDRTGALVSFSGRVKSPSHHKEVDYLFYEADESLAKSLFVALLDEAKSLYAIELDCALHRLQRVNVGEEAVYISVRARHREEAFLACRFLIDELKLRLPIFKKEVFLDDTFSWDQCRSEQPAFLNDEAPLLPAKKAINNENAYKELAQKRVLLVGAGGLSCSTAFNLVATGLKHLTIYDGDLVEASNLGRQFVFNLDDIGHSKAIKLRDFLCKRFRMAHIEAIPHFLQPEDMLKICPSFDLIIDATDSASTKALLASLSVLKKLPLIAGNIHQDDGSIHYFDPNDETSGCANCFQQGFLAPGFSCQESGVLPALAMLVGANMAHLAVQFLMNVRPKESFLKLLGVNTPEQQIAIPKDPECLLCRQKIDETILFAPLTTQWPSTKPVNFLDVRSMKEQALRPLPNELSSLKSNHSALHMLACESGRRSEYAAIKYRLQGREAYSLQNGLKGLPEKRIDRPFISSIIS